MNRLRSFFKVLIATLREIFDENAYQRFLIRTGNVASVESYRAFLQERDERMTQKPRCC